ncbi:MAG TPA: hypothetical protein VJ140_19635 [Actinomycetota bacterium]|nr:hypothetical protein [Actinomycetota bacterium]
MLEAEVLLAATGLLQPPDQTARLASRTLLADLRVSMLAVLEREEPTALRVNDQTRNYHKKLAATPPYEAIFESVAASDGETFAAAYQAAHMNARQLLLDRWPAVTIDGIFGTQIVDPDHESLAQWLLEADTVENQRLIKDLAAAAILPETVEVFQLAFPLVFADLKGVLNKRLAELADEHWAPPPWLDCSLRTFLQLPVEAIPPAPPPVTPPPSRAKLAAEELETPAERSA